MNASVFGMAPADSSTAAERNITTESLMTLRPDYLQPIEESEYIEPCFKFADKFSGKELPSALQNSGVNSGDVLIITPESIVRAVFSDNAVRAGYFMELLNSKEKLEDAFKKFVDSTQVSEDDVLGIVSLDRANRYKEYIYKTIIDGFNIKTYRERIVSFLAALEYRKKLNPQFQIQFNIIDKIEERLKNDDLLLLGFEYKDGRHYEDVGINGVRLTVPFDLQKNSDYDDTYVCMHEIGHAIHDLLGINSRRVPLSKSSENIWMRNTFFPLLSIAEKIMPVFINQVKGTIQKGILGGEVDSVWDYCDHSLQRIKSIYLDESQPYDKDEFNRMGITQLENALLDGETAETLKNSKDANDISTDLLKQTVKLGAMNRSFYGIWTNAEEMIQIIGVASAGKYIVVDRNSDLSAFCERNRSIRWGHKSFPAEDVINTNYAMAKMLVPNENEYLRSLFSLHGLDFQEYKQRIKENNLSSAK
jgi:hypothetical protein